MSAENQMLFQEVGVSGKGRVEIVQGLLDDDVLTYVQLIRFLINFKFRVAMQIYATKMAWVFWLSHALLAVWTVFKS